MYNVGLLVYCELYHLPLAVSKVGYAHSAHLGYFRRLPPASDIRLGRNG